MTQPDYLALAKEAIAHLDSSIASDYQVSLCPVSKREDLSGYIREHGQITLAIDVRSPDLAFILRARNVYVPQLARAVLDLEAKAVQMRQAIERLHAKVESACYHWRDSMPGGNSVASIQDNLTCGDLLREADAIKNAALASPAGAALRERLEAAERERDALRAAVRRWQAANVALRECKQDPLQPRTVDREVAAAYAALVALAGDAMEQPG